jgi:hypothetical protein
MIREHQPTCGVELFILAPVLRIDMARLVGEQLSQRVGMAIGVCAAAFFHFVDYGQDLAREPAVELTFKERIESYIKADHPRPHSRKH